MTSLGQSPNSRCRARLAPDLTRDQDLLWAIGQIHLEGMADLINIPGQLKKPETKMTLSEKRYLDYYRKNSEIFRAMDDLMARMQENPANRRELAAKLKTTGALSGRPTGYFMAETIVRELGKDHLIGTVFNPFSFFTLYNDAARKSAGSAPALSEKLLELLRSLENCYMK